MASDREIAGIRCTQILAGLSDYLAGDLPEETVSRVNAHLAECTWCEHFGGEFGTLVRRLRTDLAAPPQPTPAQTDALIASLDLE